MAFFVQLELTSNCARDATIRVRLLFPVFATNDAVANKDVDLLICLAALYVGALLLSAGIKLAIRIQRVLISAQIVHTLRRSVFYCIYTIPPVQDQSPREWLGCCRRGRSWCHRGLCFGA